MLNRKYLLIGFILLNSFFQLLNAQNYQVGNLITNSDGSQGVVFFVHPDGTGGWMVALNDASTGCAWGITSDIPTLFNINSTTYSGSSGLYYAALYDTAGYSNTQKIRAFQSNSNTYAAGKMDFANGWYLPSMGQLLELYSAQPFINTSLSTSGGTILSSTVNYWSSSEYDATQSWSLGYSLGNSGYTTKTTTSYGVRAVRSFSNQTLVYDTTLTYQWSTGSMQPFIAPSPTATTTYTVTATSGIGCTNSVDQIIFVNSAMSQTIYDTVCVSYPYQENGFNIIASDNQISGTTVHTRTVTQDSCQATIQLYLFKKPNKTATLYVAICQGESYYLNGIGYYNSGTYTQNLDAVDGCDSILTLNLTFYPAITTVINQTACNSYTWNDYTYTQSGDYIQSFTGQNGCDSTVTLHLTLHQTLYSTLKDTICSNNSYTGFGFNIPTSALTTPGTFYFKDTLTTHYGCDSIVILILTILGTPNITILSTPEVICSGDTTHLVAIDTGTTSTTIYYAPVVAIGDILCTDGSIVKPTNWPVPGKTAMGVVFYVDTSGIHGWAVHLQNQSTGIAWSNLYNDISNLPNKYTKEEAIIDFNGYNNTQLIRAEGDEISYPAAWIVDFPNGWYLPAAGQLRKLLSVIPWLNNTLQIVGGIPFPTHLNGGGDTWLFYRSSTELDFSNAWVVSCVNNLCYYNKTFTNYYSVRSIRSF